MGDMADDYEARAMDAMDEDFCPECGSSMYWFDCETCGGEGVDGHECGEDTCACLEPGDNVVCDICEGAGGWYRCNNLDCKTHGE